MATAIQISPINCRDFSYNIPLRVLELARDLKVSAILSAPCLTRAKVNLKERTITISSNAVQEDALASLAVELYNLAAKPQFDQIAKENLSCDEFVRKNEEIEYENIQKAAKLMSEEGIVSRYLQDMTTYGFEAHYLIQQASGHARMTARRYPGSQSDFRGTWYHKIDTDEERRAIFDTLLYFKQAKTTEKIERLKVLQGQPKIYRQLTKTLVLRDLFPDLEEIISQVASERGIINRIFSCFSLRS